MALNVIDRTQQAGFGNQFGQLNGVQAIILHHTGGGGDANGVISTFQERGLPAQYVIDQDGNVYQTLPNGARGQQIVNGVDPISGRPLNNANTIGIEIIGANDAAWTPAQIASAQTLTSQLQQQYGLPSTAVYGHSEVNPRDRENEGAGLATSIRNGTPYGSIQTASLPTSNGLALAGSSSQIEGGSGFSHAVTVPAYAGPSTLPNNNLGPLHFGDLVNAAMSGANESQLNAIGARIQSDFNKLPAVGFGANQAGTAKDLMDYINNLPHLVPGALEPLKAVFAANPALLEQFGPLKGSITAAINTPSNAGSVLTSMPNLRPGDNQVASVPGNISYSNYGSSGQPYFGPPPGNIQYPEQIWSPYDGGPNFGVGQLDPRNPGFDYNWEQPTPSSETPGYNQEELQGLINTMGSDAWKPGYLTSILPYLEQGATHSEGSIEYPNWEDPTAGQGPNFGTDQQSVGTLVPNSQAPSFDFEFEPSSSTGIGSYGMPQIGDNVDQHGIMIDNLAFGDFTNGDWPPSQTPSSGGLAFNSMPAVGTGTNYGLPPPGLGSFGSFRPPEESYLYTPGPLSTAPAPFTAPYIPPATPPQGNIQYSQPLWSPYDGGPYFGGLAGPSGGGQLPSGANPAPSTTQSPGGPPLTQNMGLGSITFQPQQQWGLSPNFGQTASGPGTTLNTQQNNNFNNGTYSTQQMLLNAGFNPGPLDGIWGPQTQAAYNAYQSQGSSGPQSLPLAMEWGSPGTQEQTEDPYAAGWFPEGYEDLPDLDAMNHNIFGL